MGVQIMVVNSRYKHLKWNQKGLAILEALPIILVMFVLMGATLGSWGVVHTAILNSIAARNSLFFYLNNRSDITYLRDFGEPAYPSLSKPKDIHYYGNHGMRFSYIASETGEREEVTVRPVDYGKPKGNWRGVKEKNLKNHKDIWNAIPDRGKNEKTVNPAWIMVGYGICLNADCRW